MDKRLAYFISNRVRNCIIENNPDADGDNPMSRYRLRFKDGNEGFERACDECDFVKDQAKRYPSFEALKDEVEADLFGSYGHGGFDKDGSFIFV